MMCQLARVGDVALNEMIVGYVCMEIARAAFCQRLLTNHNDSTKLVGDGSMSSTMYSMSRNSCPICS